jgi:hypothetical protein
MLVAAYMEKHPGSPQTIKQHPGRHQDARFSEPLIVPVRFVGRIQIWEFHAILMFSRAKASSTAKERSLRT